MKQYIKISLLACAIASGCANSQRSIDRTLLLGSAGPEIKKDSIEEYFKSLDTLRSLYSKIRILDKSGKFKNLSSKNSITPGDLVQIRHGIFAYIDNQCDAYIDAIFWAARSRGGATSANGAIAGATGAIVGATGGTGTALAVIAAAFGLSSNLFDSYYDTFLYSLEPSGIQRLVSLSRLKFREGLSGQTALTSEGVLLTQVQDYIRLCTPAYIEFLVNASIQKADPFDRSNSEQPSLLLFNNFTLLPDGTVIGPDDEVYPPFGEPEIPERAMLKLLDNGMAEINGNTVNLNGAWRKPAESAENEAAPEQPDPATPETASTDSVPALNPISSNKINNAISPLIDIR